MRYQLAFPSGKVIAYLKKNYLIIALWIFGAILFLLTLSIVVYLSAFAIHIKWLMQHSKKPILLLPKRKDVSAQYDRIFNFSRTIEMGALNGKNPKMASIFITTASGELPIHVDVASPSVHIMGWTYKWLPTWYPTAGSSLSMYKVLIERVSNKSWPSKLEVLLFTTDGAVHRYIVRIDPLGLENHLGTLFYSNIWYSHAPPTYLLTAAGPPVKHIPSQKHWVCAQVHLSHSWDDLQSLEWVPSPKNLLVEASPSKSIEVHALWLTPPQKVKLTLRFSGKAGKSPQDSSVLIYPTKPMHQKNIDVEWFKPK